MKQPGVQELERSRRYMKPPSLGNESFYRRHGKRFLDVGLVLLALPLVVPLVGILWLIARLDGGPGFYGSRRFGRNRQVYTCWKIRTMVVDADRKLHAYLEQNHEAAHQYEHYSKIVDDPRITWVGKYLRRLSLDELPQVWNVLKGEMSIVGPRPFVCENQHEIERFHRRELACLDELKPGITGPQQVSGRHRTLVADRVEMSLQYYERLSLMQDSILIFRTVGVVFSSSGS